MRSDIVIILFLTLPVSIVKHFKIEYILIYEKYINPGKTFIIRTHKGCSPCFFLLFIFIYLYLTVNKLFRD